MFGEAMIKRIIVAGSRNYHNYQEAESYINFCICRIRKEYNLVFVSGGCRGADALGERYAISNGYAVERHPAKWQLYGRSNKEPNNDNVRRLCYLFLGLPKPRDCLFNRIC